MHTAAFWPPSCSLESRTTDSKPLGERITAARLKLHYTLKQAAEIWQFKQGAVVNWEYNGTIPREPDRTKLFAILAAIERHSKPPPISKTCRFAVKNPENSLQTLAPHT